MALEDIFLLSRLLERAEEHPEPLAATFNAYEEIRRPRVEALAAAATDTGAIRKDTTVFQLRLREAAIRAGFWLYKTAGLQRWGIGMNQILCV